MLKRLALLTIIAQIGSFFVMSPAVAAVSRAETLTNAYKAMVKINTYTLNIEEELDFLGHGSGAIIDPSGIILTNYHVVSAINLETGEEVSRTGKVGYQICLTKTQSTEPDCRYTGSVIAKDKATDVALLKMEPISSEQIAEFSYLDLNRGTTPLVSSSATVLGYPAIGGRTITTTKGTVTGFEEDSDKKWLKTDAIISYGSSGGAMVNDAGVIIGLTTEARSDYLSSLGYVQDIKNILAWIDENRAGSVRPNTLAIRLRPFSRVQHEMKAGNTFTDRRSKFSITKNKNWDFSYQGESSLIIKPHGTSDESLFGFLDIAGKKGGIMVSFFRVPYYAHISNPANWLKYEVTNLQNTHPDIWNFSSASSLFSFSGIWELAVAESSDDSFVPVMLNNVAANRVTPADSDDGVMYVLRNKDTYITIVGFFGEDKQSKKELETMLNGITMDISSNNLNEFPQDVTAKNQPNHLTRYSQLTPPFSFTTSKDWWTDKQPLRQQPIALWHNKFISSVATVSVIDDRRFTNAADNDSLLAVAVQSIIDTRPNAIIDDQDENFEVSGSDLSFVWVKYRLCNCDTDDVLTDVTYIDEWYIKNKRHVLRFRLSTPALDDAAHNTVVADFLRVLASLKLSR